MKKVKVEDIYIEIVTESYNVILPILEVEAIKFIKKNILLYASNIQINLYRIEIKDFKEFLNAPQIKYLLIDCLRSLILSEFVDEKNRKILVADNVIYYCLEVIEKYYPLISDDRCVRTIIEFFKLIFISRHLARILKKYKNIFLKLHKQDYIKYEIYKNSLQRVKNELSIKYRYNNLNFEDVKDKYQNKIRQNYEQGFIYFLGDFQFNDFYISPILLSNNNNENKNIDQYARFNIYTKTMSKKEYRRVGGAWKNIFCLDDIVYVIGGPGSGKSLFLQNIINNYKEINIKKSQDFLLIYCDLRTFWFDEKDDIKSVGKFLQESMISNTGVSDITQEFLQYYLDQGRCIVLLDALDEVPKKARDNVHGKIINYFSTCNPNNKVCITSRDRGFIPKRDIKSFQISPLIRYDIEEYLDKMISLKKFKGDHKLIFLEQAQVLIDKGFLNNFLVLSLLVNIFKAEKELPENKIELYKKCFDYIAKKREEEKSKSDYDWAKIYPLMKDSTFMVLSQLAIPNNNDFDREEIEKQLKEYYKRKYSNDAETDNAINEFLNFCSNRTELIVPSTVDNKFRFFHRTFFEYFYAKYLCQQSSVKNIYKDMNMFDIDSEIFELTVALIKQENEIKYQNLLDYIFEQLEIDVSIKDPNFFSFGVLTLAMQVVDDRYYIDKYYKIIINHITYMKNKKISRMNQHLLQIYMQKGIEDNHDRKIEFKNTYEFECIKYILNLFFYAKKRKESDMNVIYEDFNDILDVEKYRGEILIEGEEPQVPFFVLVYQNYFDIGKVLRTFNEKTVVKWINRKNKIIPDDEIYILNKGYQNYRNFKEEDCKEFLQFYLSKKSN